MCRKAGDQCWKDLNCCSGVCNTNSSTCQCAEEIGRICNKNSDCCSNNCNYKYYVFFGVCDSAINGSESTTKAPEITTQAASSTANSASTTTTATTEAVPSTTAAPGKWKLLNGLSNCPSKLWRNELHVSPLLSRFSLSPALGRIWNVHPIFVGRKIKITCDWHRQEWKGGWGYPLHLSGSNWVI